MLRSPESEDSNAALGFLFSVARGEAGFCLKVVFELLHDHLEWWVPSCNEPVLNLNVLACRRAGQVSTLDPSEHHFQRLALELNMLLQLLSVLPR